MAWAWRAATATELKKQKPQAASCSAWWPGGRTTAMPFKTWGRNEGPRSNHYAHCFPSPCPLVFPVFSFPPFHCQLLGQPSPAAPSPWLHFPVSKPVVSRGLLPIPLSSGPAQFSQGSPLESSRTASLNQSPTQNSHTSPASTASTRQHEAPVASCAQAKVLGQM